MIKYGLKIRSNNKYGFDQLHNVVGNKFFDFIELYIIPKDADPTLLKGIEGYEINIHAPHGLHGFNPMDPESKAEELRDDTMAKYIYYFKPEHIVMHPEHGDNIETLKKRLDYFNDKRILIENMPKYPIKGYSFIFFGYTIKQLEEIQNLGYGICLDFEKAIKSALAQNIDYKEFIIDIIREFNPIYFHLSGCDFQTKEDQHLNLQEAEFDIQRVKNLLVEIGNKKDIFLVLETPRTGENLDNDLKNLEYFKRI